MKTNEVLDVVRAVQFGDVKAVREAINGGIVSPNTTDESGCSLLHWAAINNRFAIAFHLIEHGANINIQGGLLMETPLHWAMRKKFLRIMNLLIRNGTDLTIRSNNGFDAVHLACQLESREMLFLLLSWDANPNVLNGDGDTPLLAVLKSDHVSDDIVRILLRFGADVNAKDSFSNSVFHALVKHKKTEIFSVAYLLTNSTSSTKPFFQPGHQNLTPWNLALQYRNYYMLRFVFDMYMFQCLPKLFPVVSTVVSFLTLHALLYFTESWIISFVVWLILHIALFEKVSQPSIVHADDRVSQGLAWAVIAAIVSEYSLFVRSHQPAAASLLFYLAACLTIYLTIKVTNTRAKTFTQTEERSELIANIINSTPVDGPTYVSHDDIAQPVRLCSQCLVDKNKGSTHCSSCNACMSAALDHHCGYVNNCIGEGNRRLFCLFLLLAAFSSMLFSICAFQTEYMLLGEACPNMRDALGAGGGAGRWWKSQKCFFATRRDVFLITWIAFYVAIWISVMLVGQLWFVGSETTSFYVMRHMPSRDSITWAEFFRNIFVFLRTGNYTVHTGSRSAIRGFERHDSGGEGGGGYDLESSSLLDHHGDLSDSSPMNRYRAGSFDIEMNSSFAPQHSAHSSQTNYSAHKNSAGTLTSTVQTFRSERMSDR